MALAQGLWTVVVRQSRFKSSRLSKCIGLQNVHHDSWEWADFSNYVDQSAKTTKIERLWTQMVNQLKWKVRGSHYQSTLCDPIFTVWTSHLWVLEWACREHPRRSSDCTSLSMTVLLYWPRIVQRLERSFLQHCPKLWCVNPFERLLATDFLCRRIQQGPHRIPPFVGHKYPICKRLVRNGKTYVEIL